VLRGFLFFFPRETGHGPVDPKLLLDAAILRRHFLASLGMIAVSGQASLSANVGFNDVLVGGPLPSGCIRSMPWFSCSIAFCTELRHD